jgi:hypothetical protein
VEGTIKMSGLIRTIGPKGKLIIIPTRTPIKVETIVIYNADHRLDFVQINTQPESYSCFPEDSMNKGIQLNPGEEIKLTPVENRMAMVTIENLVRAQRKIGVVADRVVYHIAPPEYIRMAGSLKKYLEQNGLNL